jgi:hypothetical protein
VTPEAMAGVTGRRVSRLGSLDLPVRRLHVELTNRCNFSCEFCPDRHMRRGRGTMSLKRVRPLLKQAGEEGLARQVHFHVMGEPLLCPHLVEAVQIARGYGLEAWVTTNASMLTPTGLRSLEAAGLSHLIISLQTPDEATFGLRGSSGVQFEEYRRRLVEAVQASLCRENETRLSVCFFANPLRRFRAPGAPPMRLVESGRELRAHMARWVEWIFRGTALEARIPDILARTRSAGVLTETRVPLTERLDFRVRILGSWAQHFAGRIRPACFGYCRGLSENFGVLWNGDYVICCADYDGETVLANASETSLSDYLALPAVQAIARGFRRYRVVHPHCRKCLGDRTLAGAIARQIGSILYFKLYRARRDASIGDRETV